MATPASLSVLRANKRVGLETFAPLMAAYRNDPNSLDLRMVYGLNCFGLSLASTWLDLGAQAVNGAPGVNWFPEPSLSIFLRNWLGGRPYSEAVVASSTTASRWWGKILKPSKDYPDQEHPWILSSRQVVFGKTRSNCLNHNVSREYMRSGARDVTIPRLSFPPDLVPYFVARWKIK